MTAEQQPSCGRVDERAVARVLEAMRAEQPVILLRRTKSGWYQVAVLIPAEGQEDNPSAA